MRTLLTALLLCTAAAAQSPFISRLNADLRAGDAERFASHFHDRYRVGVITRDLARELTATLAFRDLSEAALTKLNVALVQIVDLALECRLKELELTRSQPFLDALQNAIAALRDLGLGNEQIARIMSRVGGSARLIVGPQLPRVQPIPPAYPTPGPDRV